MSVSVWMTNLGEWMDATKKSAEAADKAALLRHLRKRKRLSAPQVVASEVLIARQAVRADIVHVGSKAVCYEIKTASDSLVRLSHQMSAYAAVFDEIWVVAATKHLARVERDAPQSAGIYELAGHVSKPNIRVHRNASKNNAVSASGLLDALPLDAILNLIRASGKRNPPRLRRDATDLALDMPLQHIQRQFKVFLIERYMPSSTRFLEAVTSRAIGPADLSLLRAWAPINRVDCDLSCENAVSDVQGYGRSFGPVPDDIRALLAA